MRWIVQGGRKRERGRRKRGREGERARRREGERENQIERAPEGISKSYKNKACCF